MFKEGFQELPISFHILNGAPYFTCANNKWFVSYTIPEKCVRKVKLKTVTNQTKRCTTTIGKCICFNNSGDVRNQVCNACDNS